ncbi:MAG: response regulator [Planctomycetota bacterium]
MRRGLAEILEHEPDMEIVGEAEEGRKGVELAHKRRPDVILMDVSMPGMPGSEAARAARDRLPDVAIIGLSMHDMDGTREHMLESGADAYLTKDTPSAQLIATIRSLHREKRQTHSERSTG